MVVRFAYTSICGNGREGKVEGREGGRKEGREMACATVMRVTAQHLCLEGMAWRWVSDFAEVEEAVWLRLLNLSLDCGLTI